MGNTRILVLMPMMCVLAACQPSSHPTAAIPRDDDLLVMAFVETGLLGCDETLFTLPSSFPSDGHPASGLQDLADWAVWSPDGRWVLLSQDGSQTLRLADAASERLVGRPLPPQEWIWADASWSPDSTRILYELSGGGIGWMDLSCLQRGEDCQPEGNFLHDGYDPAWSPDGKAIAFAWTGGLETESPWDTHIFVAHMDNPANAMEIAGTPRQCWDPDWSPDGTRLVFECNWDIYVSGADGAAPANLTGGPVPKPDGWPVDEQPSWTPTGGRIAFLSEREPGGDYLQSCSDFNENAIYTMNPDGSDVRRITLLEDSDIDKYTWIVHSR